MKEDIDGEQQKRVRRDNLFCNLLDCKFTKLKCLFYDFFQQNLIDVRSHFIFLLIYLLS